MTQLLKQQVVEQQIIDNIRASFQQLDVDNDGTLGAKDLGSVV